MTETITIQGDFIKLDALMKFASLTASGGEAKMAIADGLVSVNGEVCTMRGKKIHPGDIISFCGEELTVQNDENS